MMLLRISALLCCLCSQVVLADNSLPPDAEGIISLIEKARTDWNVPGLSVAIVRNGEVFLSRGFGVREINRPEPVDGDTLFAIASNTKAFTAAALAILQEEGKLHWHDRVQQHLPWMQMYDPYVSQDLRVDDLLCHRSGLGTFSGDLLWWGTPYSASEVLRRMKQLPAKGPFRAHYGYSNLMYLAAGEVITSASGETWHEVIQKRILTPLEMSRTVSSVKSLESLGNVAQPHKTRLNEAQLESVTPIPWYNWDNMAAAGGLISSSNDMTKWLQVQLARGRIDGDRRLFSEASSYRMWSPHTIIPVSEAAQKRSATTHFRAYGLGWSLSDYRGRKLVAHGGGYDGMYSQVCLVPDEQLGIVVLTNSMTGLPSALTNTLVDQFLTSEDPEQQTDWLTSGLERDRSHRTEFYDRIHKQTTQIAEGAQMGQTAAACVGTFRCPMYGDLSVEMEGEHLVLKLLPNPDLVADLSHLHYDTWLIRWRKEFAWFDQGTVQFVPDERGVFQELRLNVPNDDLWFDELMPRRVP